LADSYSVDWSTFAAAGLHVAICGYSTMDPEPTIRALAVGSGGRRPAIVVGGSMTTQAAFADRYERCNGGAMGLSKSVETPDFFVPKI
jgi:hypothetical protein